MAEADTRNETQTRKETQTPPPPPAQGGTPAEVQAAVAAAGRARGGTAYLNLEVGIDAIFCFFQYSSDGICQRGRDGGAPALVRPRGHRLSQPRGERFDPAFVLLFSYQFQLRLLIRAVF